jgi:hypothetical protein
MSVMVGINEENFVGNGAGDGPVLADAAQQPRKKKGREKLAPRLNRFFHNQ